jgi:hypothetical protein
MQAMGGVHSTLGADISSISGNPAGLGFYKKGELLLTSKFSNKSNSCKNQMDFLSI